jgi:hypothetical protein
MSVASKAPDYIRAISPCQPGKPVGELPRQGADYRRADGTPAGVDSVDGRLMAPEVRIWL